MSSEAERITTTGERSPGGVPNLTPAQYMLACRPDMWVVAAQIITARAEERAAMLTDAEWDALRAARLATPGGNPPWNGTTRAWCLASLAIRKAHEAGLAERDRRRGEEIPGVHYNAD